MYLFDIFGAWACLSLAIANLFTHRASHELAHLCRQIMFVPQTYKPPCSKHTPITHLQQIASGNHSPITYMDHLHQTFTDHLQYVLQFTGKQHGSRMDLCKREARTQVDAQRDAPIPPARVDKPATTYTHLHEERLLYHPTPQDRRRPTPSTTNLCTTRTHASITLAHSHPTQSEFIPINST